MDETTWRIDGRSAWMWAFVEKWTTVFVVRYSRGHDVPMEVLGRHTPGVNITDRYRAYDTLASQTGDSQQYCSAHILLDARELSEFHGDEGAEIYGTLCSLYIEAKTYNHHGSAEDERRLIHALGALDHAYSNGKCSSFVKSLLSATDKLFLFVRMDIESTNNTAERAIRPIVVARKVSGGSRSDTGAETTCKLAGVIQTLRKRKLDLFTDGARLIRPSPG
jgi:transposase